MQTDDIIHVELYITVRTDARISGEQLLLLSPNSSSEPTDALP